MYIKKRTIPNLHAYFLFLTSRDAIYRVSLNAIRNKCMKNKKDTQQGVFCGRRGIRRLVQGEQEGVYSLLQLAAAEAAPATPGRG